MNDNCALNLLSFEPVVAQLWRVEWQPEGLTIQTRHRHTLADFGACRPFDYTRLALDEACDVASILLEELGPFSYGRTPLDRA